MALSQHSYVKHSVKASLVEYLDKYIMIILRDGTTYIGELRTFDQFTNVVLEDSWIKHYINDFVYESYIGTLLIRGDNVVFFAEIDPNKDQQIKRITKQEYIILQKKKKNSKKKIDDFHSLFSKHLMAYQD